MPLVWAHLRVRPRNGQTHRSAPTGAAILPLEIEFLSNLHENPYRFGVQFHINYIGKLIDILLS
jgi:hypothetical protein